MRGCSPGERQLNLLKKIKDGGDILNNLQTRFDMVGIYSKGQETFLVLGLHVELKAVRIVPLWRWSRCWSSYKFRQIILLRSGSTFYKRKKKVFQTKSQPIS